MTLRETDMDNLNTSEVSLKDYIDIRIKNVEDKIDALSTRNDLLFASSKEVFIKAEESMLVRLESMNQLYKDVDKRIMTLEEANAFSLGRLWVVMEGFVIIPTVIAVIAFIRSLS